METRQPGAYTCVIVTGVAATITLVLRMVARKLTKVQIWFDDWFAILGYVRPLLPKV
jgi:hypothetical protein